MNYNFYIHFISLRTSGIEPESRPWKGGVLPLYHMRLTLQRCTIFMRATV